MDTHTNRRPNPAIIGLTLPTGTDAASVRARVIIMERLLERSLVIPGINVPVGLDALVGLVPVLGDVLTAAMGAYIVWEARNLGMSKWKLARMGANVVFDTVLGVIPLVGDAADLMFRSNTRNLKLILKHIDKHHPEARIIEG
ncbi:DUF4112 domain-containing protein [Porphyrobacter sp. AAP60]|jgi:hypothetical protein|uniref:DUF4112 domain-containing protein n=1 Tax=Porphyrobacter sp. AAP60 TaxID=1523423 RepID=UPI0006B93CAA|nr:DUF4112 domain-containing protein [Porphyrobacter sp. AAP60]KPF63025.1 hypothetical protein IP79_10690 [Porphyrobacter sp. AAP60]